MISTARTNNPSAYVKARAATMAVKQIGPTAFRVTPSEKGKRPKVVQFLMGVGDMAIECYDARSKKDCPANSCARHCSHVEAAIGQLLKLNE
jgi:hypothetical protein